MFERLRSAATPSLGSLPRLRAQRVSAVGEAPRCRVCGEHRPGHGSRPWLTTAPVPASSGLFQLYKWAPRQCCRWTGPNHRRVTEAASRHLLWSLCLLWGFVTASSLCHVSVWCGADSILWSHLFGLGQLEAQVHKSLSHSLPLRWLHREQELINEGNLEVQ